MVQQVVKFRDLEIMDYQSAWDIQEELLQENVRIKSNHRIQRSFAESSAVESITGNQPATQHFLLFVQHPPVYTLGKSGNIKNVLISEEERAERAIEFFNTNRGGDITFHGPGQLVGYPIFDLEKFYTDIGRYLRDVEEVIICTLKKYGICGERSRGETGVWIEPGSAERARKICAIGVRCSRWITMHGFAFNVNTNLDYFNHIIPCGIHGKQVTSLEKELGGKVDMEEVKTDVRKNFEEVFRVRVEG